MFIRYDGKAAPCINLAIGGPTTFLGEEVEMPSVHYGRVTEQALSALWESHTCLQYRDRFRERVRAYEGVFVDSLTGGSRPSHGKAH